MKHRFVVLEGFDGSGKSSVGQRLAEAIGGVYLRTPPVEWDAHREVFDRAGVSVEARYLFYLSGVVVASERIREMIHRCDVVCDRFVLSTNAYHKCLGMRLPTWIKSIALIKPDATFFLEVPEVERRQRVAGRNLTSRFDEWLERVEIRSRIRQYMKAHGAEFITNAGDMERTVAALIERLSKLPGDVSREC